MDFNSFNDWDPLEEIIVGHPGSARVQWTNPGDSFENWTLTFPRSYYSKWKNDLNNFDQFKPVSNSLINSAINCVESLKIILRRNNVNIKSVENIDWGSIQWKSPFYSGTMLSGTSGWNPRDILITTGQCILQSPLCWRQRSYEWIAYNKLRNEYILNGNEWICSPPVMRKESLYNDKYANLLPNFINDDDKTIKYKANYILNNNLWGINNEDDIMWEAADILRCGKDIFIQRSHVTNMLGIKWLNNILKLKGFRVHQIKFKTEPYAIHVDTSIALLRPGIALYSPSKGLDKNTIDIFKKSGWKLYPLPHDKFKKYHPYKEHCDFALNFLSINEQEIICGSEYTAKWLKGFGCRVNVVDYTPGMPFVGGIHCNTLDIKRKGGMKDYLSAAAAMPVNKTKSKL